MKNAYDTNDKTSTFWLKILLEKARAEKRIYVVANLVLILRERGSSAGELSFAEKTTLLQALQSIRRGKKLLAHWLPIGYQTARFVSLARSLTDRKIILTKIDVRRIKRAAYFYRVNDDRYNRRQLRSLIATAKNIGLHI